SSRSARVLAGISRWGSFNTMPISAAVPTTATITKGNRQLDWPSTSPTGTPSAVAVIQPPSTNDNARPRWRTGARWITYPLIEADIRQRQRAETTRPPIATAWGGARAVTTLPSTTSANAAVLVRPPTQWLVPAPSIGAATAEVRANTDTR